MTLNAGRVSALVDNWAAAAGSWMERHWPLVLTGAFAGIALLAALAPLLVAWGWDEPATCIYRVFGLVYHQRPERSFWWSGQQMALCARDMGLLGGAAAGGGEP